MRGVQEAKQEAWIEKVADFEREAGGRGLEDLGVGFAAQGLGWPPLVGETRRASCGPGGRAR